MTVVVQWQESGTVIASGRQFVNATNTVLYDVQPTANDATFAIAKVDVWADVSVYAGAFCAGSVTCVAA